MSASTRERTVMVLGLVALMLFATNLVHFAKSQFFGHDRHEVADVSVVHRHDIVVAPMAPMAPMAPIPPQHLFEMQRALELEALAQAEAQMAEEAARLAEESARLSADGHGDAAASLREAVSQMREELSGLREHQMQLKVEMETAASAAEQARLEAVLAAPDAVFDVERIRVGDTEVSVVVKS